MIHEYLSTVVLSKGQNSLSVFIWAVSSLDQGTVVVLLCILDETRTKTRRGGEQWWQYIPRHESSRYISSAMN